VWFTLAAMLGVAGVVQVAWYAILLGAAFMFAASVCLIIAMRPAGQ